MTHQVPDYELTEPSKRLLERWTTTTKPSDQVPEQLRQKWQAWRDEFERELVEAERAAVARAEADD